MQARRGSQGGLKDRNNNDCRHYWTACHPETGRFFPRQLRISSYEMSGRRHSRPVQEAADFFSWRTAPMMLHYPAGPRAPPAASHLPQGSPAGGRFREVFQVHRQYCE
jgi:hypothetical protein